LAGVDAADELVAVLADRLFSHWSSFPAVSSAYALFRRHDGPV
jgi:hypothetical protein